MHIYEYLLCFMNVYFQMLAKNPEKKKVLLVETLVIFVFCCVSVPTPSAFLLFMRQVETPAEVSP